MHDIKNQWIACSTGEKGRQILETLSLTNRQYRLFAVGCCRLAWDKVTHQTFRTSVEVAERFAYGKTTAKELDEAREEARRVWVSSAESQIDHFLAAAYYVAFYAYAFESPPVCNVANCCATVIPYMTCYQATLLDQIVGEGVNIPKHVLTSTVTNLAKYIWNNMDWSVMPILADALQDAGFSDNNILEQFRTETVWCRGGKAIDLLAGIQ